MRAVGVRELKARLSQYLRDVQAGEVVLVTDRGRVVAELRSPGSAVEPESAVDRALRRLAGEDGLVVREPHDPRAYSTSPLTSVPGTAARLLEEERDEG